MRGRLKAPAGGHGSILREQHQSRRGVEQQPGYCFQHQLGVPLPAGVVECAGGQLCVESDCDGHQRQHGDFVRGQHQHRHQFATAAESFRLPSASGIRPTGRLSPRRPYVGVHALVTDSNVVQTMQLFCQRQQHRYRHEYQQRVADQHRRRAVPSSWPGAMCWPAIMP